MIKCDGASIVKVGYDRIEKLDIVVLLNQANTINLYSNQSVIRSYSNPNESIGFNNA